MDSIVFRTTKRRIEVPWEKVGELKRRLTEISPSAAEAIDTRAPAGVVFTPAQKEAALKAIEEWMLEHGIDDLGAEVVDLRDELLDDLGQLPG